MTIFLDLSTRASHTSKAVEKILDSLIDGSRLFGEDHMGAPLDYQLPGPLDFAGEVFGVFRRGHYVLAAAKSQGWQFDFVNPVHNVEPIAAKHIVE